MTSKIFRTHDAVEVETLPHGPHHWIARADLTGSEQLNVVRVETGPGHGHAFHRHPNMEEVIYVLEGRAEQWVGKERRVLGPGEAAFIPQDVVHATYNTTDETLIFLAILSPARALDETGVVDVSTEEPWRSLKPPA